MRALTAASSTTRRSRPSTSSASRRRCARSSRPLANAPNSPGTDLDLVADLLWSPILAAGQGRELSPTYADALVDTVLAGLRLRRAPWKGAAEFALLIMTA